jgi:hypothetical protein
VKKSLGVLLIVLFFMIPFVQVNATSDYEIYASSNKGTEMVASETVIIEGKILNASDNNKPVVGAPVHLEWINPDGTIEESTKSSDTEGRFQFLVTPTKIGQASWRCYFDGAYTAYSTINVIKNTSSPTPTIEPTPTATPSNSPTNQNTFTPTPTTSTLSTQTPSQTATTTPVQTPDPNIFSLQANSTVSGFSFDSTNQELMFNVTGPSGSVGCTNVTIAKSFLANVDNLKVYLDGTQIDYIIISSDTFWLLTFTYQHSTHQIKISLPAADEPAFFDITLAGVILTAIIVGVLLSVLGTIVYRKKHR